MTLHGVTTLRLSDPAYTDRLSAFLKSLGQNVTSAAEGEVTLEREISEAELRIYLRVWNVLHPGVAVTED